MGSLGDTMATPLAESRAVCTIIGGLIGACLGVGLLAMSVGANTVTRVEMQEYIEATATEHLRTLRADLRSVNTTLSRVGERLAAVEAILRERP